MTSAFNILLLEDNELDYQLTKALLTSSHAKVFRVLTLEDAVKAVNERPFDAVLLDLGVSDSQGLRTFDKFPARLNSFRLSSC